MSNFVHLNTKSDYSLAEGALTIQKLADLCSDNKMPAIAVTDNNNLFGALEFSETISKAGIQPIIGAKIRIKTPSQFVIDPENENDKYFYINLLSRNEIGYKNWSVLNNYGAIIFENKGYIDILNLIKLETKNNIILDIYCKWTK